MLQACMLMSASDNKSMMCTEGTLLYSGRTSSDVIGCRRPMLL